MSWSLEQKRKLPLTAASVCRVNPVTMTIIPSLEGSDVISGKRFWNKYQIPFRLKIYNSWIVMLEPTGEGRGAGHPREPFLTSQANGGLQVFEILMGSWGSPWIGSESSGLVTLTGGSKFHAHHPAINSYQHLSWYVSDEGPFKPFNLMFGLSYNTSFAYQKSSTRYTDSNAEAFNLSKPTSHPFKVWQ